MFLSSGLHFDKDWIPYTSIRDMNILGLEIEAFIPEEDYVLSGFETSSSLIMIVVKCGQLMVSLVVFAFVRNVFLMIES